MVNRPTTRPTKPLSRSVELISGFLDRSCLAVGSALLDFHNRRGWSTEFWGEKMRYKKEFYAR